jgi:hypothetical protein
MRLNFIVFVLAVTCGSAFGQHVVRSGFDPLHRENQVLLCSEVHTFGDSDPCEVPVYDTKEIDKRLTQAGVDCKAQIDTAKAELASDINKLPSVAIDALKAQMKQELKDEILSELFDDIRTGKLKLSALAPTQKTH